MPPHWNTRLVRSGELPDNIGQDFFLQSGQRLVPLAQQHYASINYTHALDE
jgi:hypothetical protein